MKARFCLPGLPPSRKEYPVIVEIPTYEARVARYEAEGMTRSDAQGVVDAEILQESRMQTVTSEEILSADDLYKLQDTFGSSGTPFRYRLTEPERGWLEFVRGRYSIADWIDRNTDADGWLVFDDPESLSQALDDDCHGWGKATCLADDTALQKLFFWLYTETETAE